MARVSKMLRSLGDHLQAGASVRNVYGDPVPATGRTVIPVARIGYGYGAGGKDTGGKDTGGKDASRKDAGRRDAGGDEKAAAQPDGSGGGAGMGARPVGVIEITEAGTRFIAFVDPFRLGVALMAGLAIGLAIGRRSPRRRS